MVRVCQEWFPNINNPDKAGFYMEDKIKFQLDILLRNIKNDWDFTIIITGNGEVRVGKSMLGMQIACYWAYQLEKLYNIKVPYDVKQNFCFEGNNLIRIGNYLGQNFPFSPLIFDEAGADLEGRKTMQSSTQAVLDFYRECGQYNMLNILILPEFFDLPKGIALNRSVFLLDVGYSSDKETGLFTRGYFKFFSRRAKKWLYIKGKKNLDYNASGYDFNGRFYRFYPIDEQEYKKVKQEALSRRETKKRSKFMLQRDALIYLLCGEKINRKSIMTQQQLAQRMEQLTGIFVAQNTISDALHRYKSEFDEKNNDNS